jgi:dihydroorotate dehydrogenase electron transfer subunit
MKKRAMSNPAYLKGEITANTRMGSLYHRLRIALPQPIGPITPGQFAMLSIAHGGGMVLPRPFSIHNFEQEAKVSWLDFLFNVVGRGTAQLADLSVGSPIMILAPMGKGFPDLPVGYKAIIIAGGMGIAPLFPLIVKLQAAHSPLSVCYGAKSHDDLVCLPELRDVGDIQIKITTEDGSGEGEKGFVTQLLTNEEGGGEAKTAIYACGPEPMLHNVSDYARERNIRCWISIERWMACGVGACLSCVVKTTDGYQRVCCDGPIFDATDITWRNIAGP